jgi:hypothetical protein
MSKSAFEKVRDRMAPETAKQTTKQLCEALSVLDLPIGSLDEAARIVCAVIIDELCERHPEVDEATARWAEDLESTQTMESVAIAAALAASA